MATLSQTFSVRMASVAYGTLGMGLVKEVKLTLKGLELGKDGYGRTITGGYEVKAEFEVMSSDNEALRELLTEINSFAANDLQINSNQGNILLPGVFLNPDFDINGSAKTSKVKLTADKTISKSDVLALFPIVVEP